MTIDLTEFNGLIGKLTTFDKMYEQARIVDPVNKEIIFVKGENGEERVPVSDSCFGVWEREEACQNCISMRAYNENETFIKIETSPNAIIMVTAIPTKIDDRVVVVELLRNVTRSMVLDNVSAIAGMEIKRLLDQANLAAVTDELTKTYNKRYILEALPVAIAVAYLENRSCTLLMTDIDHFKIVNDTHGHLAGDHILQEFAAILKRNIRHEQDWVARFGGEEFLVCLMDTDAEVARIVAERMRTSIAETVFEYNGLRVELTASFGLCSIDYQEMKDYEALIHCADQRLYEAKSAGRNKVVG